MPNGNPSAPLSLTTSIVPGAVAAVSSGVGVGTHNASSAATAGIKEINSKDSGTLLKAIDVLSNALREHDKDKAPGLDLFPEEIRGLLAETQGCVATTAQTLSLAPIISLMHLSQLPLDVKACVEGLIHSVENYRGLSKTKEASYLDLEAAKSGFSANSRELYDQLGGISRALSDKINEEFKGDGNAAHSHLFTAKSMAFPVLASGAGTASLVAAVFDSIGASFREVSALALFSKQESDSPNQNERNIYQAFAKCCASGCKSEDSIAALQQLQNAISNFVPARFMSDKHAVSGPTLSVFLRMVTSAPFVASLQSVISSSIAITAAHKAESAVQDKMSVDTKLSATKASSVKGFSGADVVTHSKNVSDFFDRFDEAMAQIDNQLHGLADNETIHTSAESTVKSHATIVTASSLVVGLFGLVSRELSGSTDFTQKDKGTKAECSVVSESRKDLTGEDLDKLMTRVCALKERVERAKELGVSAPVVLGTGESITCGALISSLNVLAGMYSALSELRTLSQSPSIPLQLNDEEKLKAQQSVASVKASNAKTGASSGSGKISEGLTANSALQSVMEKLVLLHRSYQNFINHQNPRKDIDFSAKSSLAFVEGNSTGFLIGSTAVLALIAVQSGIGSEAFFKATRISTNAKRASDGPDKIVSGNGTKTNASFVSNLTRLSELSQERENKSTASQTTSRAIYLTAESTFSRSLTIALCHSGALKEILKRLIKEEQDNLQHVEGQLDSALISDGLVAKLELAILKVLDDADANHNPIPGLKDDAASTIASASKSTIASTLSAHATFIVPFLKTTVASHKAADIPDNVKNEGVWQNSVIGKETSTALNMIQAFTNNFAHAMGQMKNPIHSSITQATDAGISGSLVASCMVSLFCEELFESTLCRWTALLDQDKVKKTADKTKADSNKEVDLSKQAIADDSGVGQPNSFSHVVSALRLTLSHLGVSLGNFASEMNSRSAIMQDNLQIHSLQNSIIKSMASTFASSSSAMLAIAAGLSALPLTSAGSVDSLRECLHSIDHHLKLRPVYSSQESSNDGSSQSSLLTGLSTDSVVSLLSTVIKLLVQGSILGLDTSLSVAKLLEILCIHPRPEEASALEFQALSQPNGLSNNSNLQSKSLGVATSLAIGGVSIATQTGNSATTKDSINSMQKVVDREIEGVDLLNDEEESKDENKQTLGLKGFYALLIGLVSPYKGTPADVADLVNRFNWGGITLSNYHSRYAGIKNATYDSNSLIYKSAYVNCDGAGDLLELFINKAFASEANSEPLLNKVRDEINKYSHLSSKVEQRWEYVVNRVMDRRKLENARKSLFNHGQERLSNSGLEQRKNDLLHPADNPLFQDALS